MNVLIISTVFVPILAFPSHIHRCLPLQRLTVKIWFLPLYVFVKDDLAIPFKQKQKCWSAFDLWVRENSRLSTNHTLHLSPLYPCQDCINVDLRHLPTGGGQTRITYCLPVSKQVSVGNFLLFFSWYKIKEWNWGMPNFQQGDLAARNFQK